MDAGGDSMSVGQAEDPSSEEELAEKKGSKKKVQITSCRWISLD